MRPNTFDDIDRLFDRMQRFTGLDDGSWNDGASPWKDGAMDSGAMKIDVSDQGDQLVVVADLPGFDHEEIDITVEGDRLIIAASHDTSEDEEGTTYVHRERASRAVRRSVSLPVEVDEDGASATYTNGVLEVSLPTVTESSGHRIDID